MVKGHPLYTVKVRAWLTAARARARIAEAAFISGDKCVQREEESEKKGGWTGCWEKVSPFPLRYLYPPSSLPR